MAEAARKRIGRPPKTPKPGERVSLGLKVTADIKRRLDEEANKSGRTQSQQAELMIERSFAEQDALAGPKMRQLAYFMATSFALAGQHSAAGNPDWITDRDCYRAGVIGVLDALLIGRDDEDAALIIEALKGRLLSRIARREETK
jgi:hypothetical protein